MGMLCFLAYSWARSGSLAATAAMMTSECVLAGRMRAIGLC